MFRIILHNLTHVVVGALMVCCLVPAVADEPKSAALMQTLADDGTWVTFNVTVDAADQLFEVKGTARSVGRLVHQGKPCRFLEYEQEVDVPPGINVPQLGNLTWRMLVPEEEFGEGKDPISKAVKTWVKIDTMPVEAVESMEQRDPIFAVLFHGPKQDLKIDEAKEKISWQRGELECTVVSGRSAQELGVIKVSMTHRVLRNSSVPFGVAGIRQDVNLSLGGGEEHVKIRATLRDYGKDAKPKLPELVP